MIFGSATALGSRLLTLDVASQLIEMIPPVVTIIALVVYNLRRSAQALANVRKFQARAGAV